jgi:hypothetical protein
VYFTPAPVRTTLPDPASQGWPEGDAPSSEPWPSRLDRAKVRAAVDLAFADPEGLTAAMVVAYKGQIVGERYMPGITKDAPNTITRAMPVFMLMWVIRSSPSRPVARAVRGRVPCVLRASPWSRLEIQTGLKPGIDQCDHEAPKLERGRSADKRG